MSREEPRSPPTHPVPILAGVINGPSALSASRRLYSLEEQRRWLRLVGKLRTRSTLMHADSELTYSPTMPIAVSSSAHPKCNICNIGFEDLAAYNIVSVEQTSFKDGSTNVVFMPAYHLWSWLLRMREMSLGLL